MLYSKERIPTNTLSDENYVSTENMLPNFGGKCRANSLPTNGSAIVYQTGDILLSNIRPYLKKVWLAKNNGGCSTDVFVLKANQEKCNSDYLHYIVASDNFIDYVMSGAKGIKMPRGDKEQIKKYRLSIPTPNEQCKIAALLSKLDTRIETQNKIIEDLKTLKSAISAKLLHNSCWNDMKIHEICHTLNYKQYIAKNIQETGEFPVIQQGDNPICGYSHETPFDNYKNVLLFGDHTLSLYKPNSKFLLATDGIKVLLPTGHIKRDFLYYLLEANMPKSEGYKRHYSILKEVNVKVPPIEEQEKISGVFIAIDDKIALEQLLKSSYKAQKAFLLQQMFI